MMVTGKYRMMVTGKSRMMVTAKSRRDMLNRSSSTYACKWESTWLSRRHRTHRVSPVDGCRPFGGVACRGEDDNVGTHTYSSRVATYTVL